MSGGYWARTWYTAGTPWQAWYTAARAAQRQGQLVEDLLAATPEEPTEVEEPLPVNLDEYRVPKRS